ncbi:MAG: DUF2286 domain-containing protein [Desulfurococcaceae archaeon]|nr:DUF2286 domain-containing protein [Desulfurococcaceae archaeon]
MATLVAHVVLGEVVEVRTVDEPIERVLRRILAEVLDLWNPRESDLVVTRERVSELKPELAERSPGTEPEFYVVSYDIVWVGDEVVDRRFYVVMEDLGELSRQVVRELAELSRVALEDLDRGLKGV